MLAEIAIEKVYLAQGATDLRKSIDELAAIVIVRNRVLILI
ncbi:transposase [Bacillus cereus]|nr:transposase [Bacillus cereus]